MMYLNRTPAWNKNNHVPSGWGHVVSPSIFQKISHHFYQRIQFMNSFKPGSRLKMSKPENRAKDEARKTETKNA